MPPFRGLVRPESTRPPPMGTTGTRASVARRMMAWTSWDRLGHGHHIRVAGVHGALVPGVDKALFSGVADKGVADDFFQFIDDSLHCSASQDRFFAKGHLAKLAHHDGHHACLEGFVAHAHQTGRAVEYAVLGAHGLHVVQVALQDVIGQLVPLLQADYAAATQGVVPVILPLGPVYADQLEDVIDIVGDLRAKAIGNRAADRPR